MFFLEKIIDQLAVDDKTLVVDANLAAAATSQGFWLWYSREATQMGKHIIYHAHDFVLTSGFPHKFVF